MPPKIIHFDYTDFGKPYLKGSQLRFNVAHTIDYIVYAIVENDDIYPLQSDFRCRFAQKFIVKYAA